MLPVNPPSGSSRRLLPVLAPSPLGGSGPPARGLGERRGGERRLLPVRRRGGERLSSRRGGAEASAISSRRGGAEASIVSSRHGGAEAQAPSPPGAKASVVSSRHGGAEASGFVHTDRARHLHQRTALQIRHLTEIWRIHGNGGRSMVAVLFHGEFGGGGNMKARYSPTWADLVTAARIHGVVTLKACLRRIPATADPLSSRRWRAWRLASPDPARPVMVWLQTTINIPLHYIKAMQL